MELDSQRDEQEEGFERLMEVGRELERLVTEQFQRIQNDRFSWLSEGYSPTFHRCMNRLELLLASWKTVKKREIDDLKTLCSLVKNRAVELRDRIESLEEEIDSKVVEAISHSENDRKREILMLKIEGLELDLDIVRWTLKRLQEEQRILRVILSLKREQARKERAPQGESTWTSQVPNKKGFKS